MLDINVLSMMKSSITKKSDYFIHESSGTVKFTDDDWIMLMCDDGILDYYERLCRNYGIVYNKRGRTGTHITIGRGKEPIPAELRTKLEGTEFKFTYTDQVRVNNSHVWLDVYSDALGDLRRQFEGFNIGIDEERMCSFHITLGRFKL
jgi:hypothetical protein